MNATLTARDRQHRHDLDGFTRKDRKVRMVFEHLSCDSARTTVKAPISLLTSAIPAGPTRLVLPSGPPISATEPWCFSTHAFQAAIPSLSLAFRSCSDSAFHAAIFWLFLLPTKTAR